MKNNDFLTVEQVADRLQVHWQTVLNYIKSGKLKALKLGKGYRISQKALDKFIKENSARRGSKK
ncbi:MAG TPA: helix-turn-helix domain-containing protein [Candidatus Bathyarchaeia archaeon]|nr:helix-turn-helix domain-containing protein [Candidatus Bathyarchaeia archaeon]